MCVSFFWILFSYHFFVYVILRTRIIMHFRLKIHMFIKIGYGANWSQLNLRLNFRFEFWLELLASDRQWTCIYIFKYWNYFEKIFFFLADFRRLKVAYFGTLATFFLHKSWLNHFFEEKKYWLIFMFYLNFVLYRSTKKNRQIFTYCGISFQRFVHILAFFRAYLSELLNYN